MDKSPDAFRTISEVAEWLDVPTHVLRFWESRFSQIKPVKRAGGRRYYRPADMELLGGIKKLLHDDGLTIRGVQKILREEGPRHVAALSPSPDGGASEDAESPMAVDVPALPPKGEVVLFKPDTAAPPSGTDTAPASNAGTHDDEAEPLPTDATAAPDNPDDVLNRWPFADDPHQEEAEPETERAVAQTDETVPGTPPPGDAADPETASGPAAQATGQTAAPASGETAVQASEEQDAQAPKETEAPQEQDASSLPPAPRASGGTDAMSALTHRIAAIPRPQLAAHRTAIAPLVTRLERLKAQLDRGARAGGD